MIRQIDQDVHRLQDKQDTFEILIRAQPGWHLISLGELWQTREVFWFLLQRDVKIRYRQTVLGAAWAVVQPLLAMVIFAMLFRRLSPTEGDGPPYPLVAFTGLVPWTFFANAVSVSSNSLLGNQNLISKIYFPRVFVPLASIGALVLDLVLTILITFGLSACYRWPMTAAILWLPLFMFGTFLAAAGLGLILSALNVQFRDIKYVVPFAIQMGLFLTPVIYPLSYVPEKYQLLAALNPMTGMVEGFHHAFLGTPARWDIIGISLTVGVALLLAGLFVFRRLERRFADII